MNEIISLDLYFRDFITKQDRRKVYASQLKPEYIVNANKLLLAVNGLLNELGIDKCDVTSGWRPATVNQQTSNAAKSSYHMICLAVDLLDNKNQDLAKLVSSRPDLLKKYGLWVENFQFTKGKNTNWCHLDLGNRQNRPGRQFNP